MRPSRDFSMTTCVDGTGRQATIEFRAGRRGFDDAPVDADCNRIRVDHDGRVFIQNHAANKDIGVCGMFWSTSFESRPQS
jgi:hypothetical protein